MHSIRRKLTFELLIALTVLSLGIGGGFFLLVRHLLISKYDEELLSRARGLLALVEVERDEIDFEYTVAALPEYAAEADPDYFEIVFSDGSPFRRSPSLEGKRLSPIEGPAPLIADLMLPDGRRGRGIVIEQEWRVPGIPTDKVEMRLYLARSREDLGETLATLFAVVLAVSLLTPLAVALIVTALVKKGLRPVSAIAARVEGVDIDSLDTRLDVAEMPVEIAPIGTKLNEVFGRLEDSVARERQFTRNAAHELRTPIAELRSITEVASKWPEDTELCRSSLKDASELGAQMDRLVSHLLALARGELADAGGTTEEVPLEGVVARIWGAHQAKAEEKHLGARIDVPDAFSVRCDRPVLETILRNLIGNAVDYTPSGGSVAIEGARSGRDVVLTVKNSGADLTADDLPFLCEPFWRKDSVRSDTQQHTGLGLALAKTFTEHLGGSIDLRLEEGGVFSVVVRLPADG